MYSESIEFDVNNKSIRSKCEQDSNGEWSQIYTTFDRDVKTVTVYCYRCATKWEMDNPQ